MAAVLRRTPFDPHPWVTVALLLLALPTTCCAQLTTTWSRHTIDNTLRGADGVKLADFNGDGRQDMVVGWEESGVTRLYLHPGYDKVHQPWPAVTIGKTPAAEDVLPIDADSDGMLDVLTMCEGSTRTIFLHRLVGATDRPLESSQWRQQEIAAANQRMMWMFAARMQPQRSSRTVAAGGKGDNAKIGLLSIGNSSEAVMDAHWQSLSSVGWVMSIIPADIDHDGDEDILLTDRRGAMRGVRWLECPHSHQADSADGNADWQNHYVGARDREVMFADLADWNNDGRVDVLAASKPAELLVLLRMDYGGKRWQTTSIAYPANAGTAKAVAVADMDQNGTLDLVATCEGATGEKSGVWWFRRDDASSNNGRWHNISGPAGIKFDRIESVDLDNDGDLDVLTCEERHQGRGLGVIWYQNPTNHN